MSRICFSNLLLNLLWGTSQSFIQQFACPSSTLTTHNHRHLTLHRVATNEAESSASALTKTKSISPEETLNTVVTATAFEQGPSCLTPYQLTLPQLFDSQVTGDDIQVHFDKALQLLRQSVEHIVRYGMNDAYGEQKILRIQQRVSHPVDPLGWLDAQRCTTEAFYLNVEKGVEVAMVGSALTVKSHRQVYPWLEWLPNQSRFYGASRFDDGNGTIKSSEWRDFGHGVWMLPKIEVVVQGDVTVVAVHIVRQSQKLVSWQLAAHETLAGLERITTKCTHPIPPTTLPPILSRDSSYRNVDGQELFECAFSAALERLNDADDALSKVVLARQQKLHLGISRREWDSLQLIRKWKYGGNEGGHLFFLNCCGSEFFGCTPERLFQVTGQTVISEALAGTRPRGSTQEEDEELSLELIHSPKDQKENTITGNYIEKNFQNLVDRGWLQWTGKTSDRREADAGNFFVRRLLHLQHICQRYSAIVLDESLKVNVTRFLLEQLHPTPAVCGFPLQQSLDFIRSEEAPGFDRGLYAGPIGYIGRDSSDILVAIRSGLVPSDGNDEATTVFTYSGAGIVKGSTLQGEWAETNYKLAVISSMFPQSPLMLQGSPTANVAWATAFVEELIRNGVTQFYVCPGSRSTPLVVAVARAVRSHVGIVSAISVHDERAAGFRALGYGRGAGRPAAVITSSGTAVSNLYPSVVEAGVDGVPVLFLTADRPYENRHTGANQAIDQVKMFSSSYIRWFRDILPPSDQVPVSVVLSDAAHAVRVTLSSRGPVHINMQFRENLAPEAGPIRNDGRVGAVERFSGAFFTDIPGYERWSVKGDKWTKTFEPNGLTANSPGVLEVAQLIRESKRGLIVVGNLRSSLPSDKRSDGSYLQQIDAISNFAQSIGFPILAGAQAVGLRFRSHAVVPFAEHLLKCPLVFENLKPDLVLQLGAPLISTAIPSVIQDAVRSSGFEVSHVLVHPLFAGERVDPDFTVTHTISSEVLPFLESVAEALHGSLRDGQLCSELAPLVTLGRKLRSEMKSILTEAANVGTHNQQLLTEPELVASIAERLSHCFRDESLFISNSMPVRDSEFFLYPFEDVNLHQRAVRVGTNRGASGIDGIIATATGFSESTKMPTTLLIGDLASLHDINSLHALANDSKRLSLTSGKANPVTTIVVNNDGGGIFSFLPIAQHGPDVSFNEFFGTPTKSFSFTSGAKAFGLPVECVTDLTAFREAFERAAVSHRHSLIEVRVVSRDRNVEVHREITKSVNTFVTELLKKHATMEPRKQRLPVKSYKGTAISSPTSATPKTFVLLHGWMGDTKEWDGVVTHLLESLTSQWEILTVDLPGHGNAPLRLSSEIQSIRSALMLDDPNEELGLEDLAASVLTTLEHHHGVKHIHALAGYSLGGRVALAMKGLALSPEFRGIRNLITSDTKLILLSAYPGDTASNQSEDKSTEEILRLTKDKSLSSRINALFNKEILMPPGSSVTRDLWGRLLLQWYEAPLWGNLQKERYFPNLMLKRSESMRTRGRDLAAVLRLCSPPRNKQRYWNLCSSVDTLFIAGSLDTKYAVIGERWRESAGINVKLVPGTGHALLVEAPKRVSKLLVEFLNNESVGESSNPAEAIPKVVRTPIQRGKTRATGDLVLQSNPVAHRERSLGSVEFELFSIDLVDRERSQSHIKGMGWGKSAAANDVNNKSKRVGFILQLTSTTGLEVGIGEVSPLEGLHAESLEDAGGQLSKIQESVAAHFSPTFDAATLLKLNGEMKSYIEHLSLQAGINRLFPSVYSGLEMALLALASQVLSQPVLTALERAHPERAMQQYPKLLPINGLITRGSNERSRTSSTATGLPRFPSIKVKVGHQSLEEDCHSMARAFQRSGNYEGCPGGKIRADANRAWNESAAIEFASALDGIDLHSVNIIEFIEEPLQKVSSGSSLEVIRSQIDALEQLYMHTGIPYALDETLADLIIDCNDFEHFKESMNVLFHEGSNRGCAAFVLKPALLGLEMSLRIAKFARTELGIGAVFSSSFDSGIGLAYTAILGSLSDRFESTAPTYPHGVGTYGILAADTLNPSFGSYVNEHGMLNIASLSRALFGLSLDELNSLIERNSLVEAGNRSVVDEEPILSETAEEAYKASTATSSSGKEISIVVSLQLPFSADVACARFTDLPQHSRWSPWITSVAYQGTETEWTLNVRGIPVKWRATSELLENPPGIQWQSVSGLSNRGRVEFIRESDYSCRMKVHMTILTPRVIRPLFMGTSMFLEDFLRDKLLKWSLEMFRDVVKADLALERGDVELGDALYSAVENKASAIEATLNGPPQINGEG